MFCVGKSSSSSDNKESKKEEKRKEEKTKKEEKEKEKDRKLPSSFPPTSVTTDSVRLKCREMLAAALKTDSKEEDFEGKNLFIYFLLFAM